MDSPLERSSSSSSPFSSGGGGGGSHIALAEVEQVLLQISQGQAFDKYSEFVDVSFLPHCQYILATSLQTYAHVVCTKILEDIIRKSWNVLTIPQKLELKTFILTLLEGKAKILDKMVIQALVRCLAKIYRLGWFDDDSFRDSLDVSNTLMATSSNHFLIGLYFLLALTDEMNIVTSDQPITIQRKYTNSFRDNQLLNIFKISLSTLKDIRSGALSTKGVPDDAIRDIGLVALNLTNSCLNYDFQGTNFEESSEDSATVQIPTAWKATVLDPMTMQLLFEFYSADQAGPHRSHKALEALTLLSSIRQSLFANDIERNAFITQLLTGLNVIFQGAVGLDYEDNYHQFCRLLSRIKTNYRLNELVKISGFNEFLELSCQFTLESFKDIEDNLISVSYLLAYWSRLVAALPYIQSLDSDSYSSVESGSAAITRLTGIILQSYISNLMSLSERIASDTENSIDNPLDDENSLRDQMDRFLILIHCQYEGISRLIIGLYDNVLAMFNQPQPPQMLIAIEEKLSWLTELIAGSIGSSGAEVNKNEDIVCDGALCRRVFQLIDVCNNRVKAGLGPASVHLEKSILQFFKSFKKSYILDMMSYVPITNYSIMTPPPHRLQSRLSLGATYLSPRGLAASHLGMMSDPNESSPLSIFDAMKIGDLANITNVIVYKLCSNINSIGADGDRTAILDETLEIFVELISSYTSSKMLLNLESIQSIVKDHSGDRFVFLRWDCDNKHRIKFYSAIMRLVFTSSEDLNNSFDLFVAPNIAFLEQLGSIANLHERPDYRVAVIQILRDFRGITQATYNKRTYNLLFDVLYPRYFELFLRIAQQFSGDVEVCIALLKFVQELAFNKCSRIIFDNCSPNGILLFREISKILCTIGSQLMSTSVVRDIYKEKYKVMKCILYTLVNSLIGGYVEIGVFSFYNDPALSNAIQLAMQICLKIPRGHLFEYGKLAKSYFTFMEVLFRNHLDMLCQLDSATFIGVLLSLLVGLDSSETVVLTSCAIAIDHLATYLFLNRNRPTKPTMQRIVAHLTEYPVALNQCMHSLFQVFLLTGNTWACTRPILSLLLAHEGCFISVREELIANQTTELGSRQLTEEFSKLTAGVQQSLEINNRDRFTQKLIAFKTNTREMF